MKTLSLLVLSSAALLAGCTMPAKQASAPAITTAAASTLLTSGYLAKELLPDSRLLVPPPPAPGSAALARDEQASAAGLALGHGPRWRLATSDAELRGPTATGALACAAGFEISPASTPAIDRLLRRALADLGASTGAAKLTYQRARPFMVNGQPQCTPEWDAALRKDGSYPSGHSAIGYGWGLILAEIVPDRATQLVARGRAFGDSRRICNVHWLSDTEEGRVVGAAVVARLHADPGFQADLAAARAEVAKARTTPPARDCAAEAATLADAGQSKTAP